MDILNRMYSISNNLNAAKSSIQAQYRNEEANENQSINELITNPQYISLLKSINEIGNINSLGSNTLDSITIPSSDIGMTQNTNLIQNQMIDSNISTTKVGFSDIDIRNNLNLFNENSSFNSKNNISQLSTFSGINSQLNMNIFDELNGCSNFTPTQMNEPSTLPLSPNNLNLNSSPLSTSITNSLLEKNTLLNNEINKQLQLLYIIKLLKKQQLLANNKANNKFNSIIIPANESNENIINNNYVTIPSTKRMESSFANSSITIPTEPIEYGLLNNSIDIPCNQSENIMSSNSIKDSITIPIDSNEDQDQLSDNLLKQFQLQEQQLASKINEISNKTEIDNEISIDNEFEDMLVDIPTITINNEKIDLIKSPDVDSFISFNSKQGSINNYTPLTPELSPYLNNDNTNSDKVLENYIKKYDNNSFSSMKTLNDIISITPQMEPENSPFISNNLDSFNNENNQNVIFNGYFDPLKAIKNETEDNTDNLLVLNNDLLNVPTTPKSISGSPNPNDCTFDLDSFDLDSLINNNYSNETESNEIYSNEEQQLLTECEDKEVGDIKSESIVISKRPRGRPKKKRVEEPPNTPEEQIEHLSKTIDEILSSDLFTKLYSKNDEQTNNSIPASSTSASQDDEKNIKITSEVTENQYDIPFKNSNIKFNDEYNDEIKVTIEIDKCFENQKENECEINDCECKVEKDEEENDDDIFESEYEEKSLSLIKKEIRQFNSENSNTEDDKPEENKEIIPIKSIETVNSDHKRKQREEDESESCGNQNKRKMVRLSIKQIKNSLENGNRMSIGNELGVKSVSALTKNGLVLIGRKRIIAENTNRPYVCSTCGAGFARKHDLNRHEKVHTGVKNYKCPYCERGFSRNDALSRHLRVELKHRSQAKEKKRGRKKGKKTTSKTN